MALPEAWLESCKKSEQRFLDDTMAEPFDADYCMEIGCPALRTFEQNLGNGQFLIQAVCKVSKCLLRYPQKNELKLLR